MGMNAERREPGLATGLTLLVPITLSTMAIVLLAPILPQLQNEYSQVPNAAYLVPMVLTMPALCVALFSPLAGLLGDYFGRRRLLIAALLAYTVVGLTALAAMVVTLLASIWVGRTSVKHA